jgi:hypothetical protein
VLSLYQERGILLKTSIPGDLLEFGSAIKMERLKEEMKKLISNSFMTKECVKALYNNKISNDMWMMIK